MDDSDNDRKPSVAEKQAIDAAVAAGASTSEDEQKKGCSDSGPYFRQPKKVKPALKKKNQGKRPKKALKWDEVTIEEHDLYRGTRMKIDEPNTPFTYYESGTESDDSRARPKSPVDTKKPALSWDALQNRLDTVAAVQVAFGPPSPKASDGETSGSDCEEKRREEMRKLEFTEHRKRHYNEMELVRRFRQEHSEDYDGDDADIEDGNEE